MKRELVMIKLKNKWEDILSIEKTKNLNIITKQDIKQYIESNYPDRYGIFEVEVINTDQYVLYENDITIYRVND